MFVLMRNKKKEIQLTLFIDGTFFFAFLSCSRSTFSHQMQNEQKSITHLLLRSLFSRFLHVCAWIRIFVFVLFAQNLETKKPKLEKNEPKKGNKRKMMSKKTNTINTTQFDARVVYLPSAAELVDERRKMIAFRPYSSDGKPSFINTASSKNMRMRTQQTKLFFVVATSGNRHRIADATWRNFPFGWEMRSNQKTSANSNTKTLFYY